jgi:hypothetical protein
MSDEALQQDLVVEEMMEREKSIGSGTHKMEDNVGSLGSSPATSMLPPPPPGGLNGATGHRSPPPPPPKGGGMYPVQRMTADELIYGDGPNTGGKKKSSKQKFAERQVRKELWLCRKAISLISRQGRRMLCLILRRQMTLHGLHSWKRREWTRFKSSVEPAKPWVEKSTR